MRSAFLARGSSWSVIFLTYSVSSAFGTTYISSSKLPPAKIFGEWTIIGKDQTVADLGYDVTIDGTNAALTQRDGAYLSGESDRRLFANGADKVFLTLDSGTRVGSRIASAPRPLTVGAQLSLTTAVSIQSIMAVGGDAVVYVCLLVSGSWCRDRSKPTNSNCPKYSNSYTYVDDSYKYVYKLENTALAAVGREVAVADGLVFSSGTGTATSSSGATRSVGAVGLFAPGNDFTTWAITGAPHSGQSESFGAAIGIVESSPFPGQDGRSGACHRNPGAADFACRFLVGEPEAFATATDAATGSPSAPRVGRVHIFTHTNFRRRATDNVFVESQVLEGTKSFGAAISTTSHTGSEIIVVGAPEEGLHGVVHLFEWNTSIAKYVLSTSILPYKVPQYGTARFGAAVDHVVTPDEVRIVVGAPSMARAYVLSTSRTSPAASQNRTVTLRGAFSGRTRAYPSSADSTTSQLGASVAVGPGYIFVGAPMFNKDKKFQHSVGAVHVVAFCNNDQYIDLSNDALGASCKDCPVPATSQGQQSMVCTGCPNIPSPLPSGASIKAGCTITCADSARYDVQRNKCIARASVSPLNTDTGSNTLLVVVSVVVILCVLCCCCYMCRTPFARDPNLEPRGRAAAGAATPTIEVVLDNYPVTTVRPDVSLPNSADSCVICLSDFSAGEAIRTLSCKHVFHKECIDNWLGSHTTCPLCNIQLTTRNVNGSPSRATVAAAPPAQRQPVEQAEAQDSPAAQVHAPAQQGDPLPAAAETTSAAVPV